MFYPESGTNGRYLLVWSSISFGARLLMRQGIFTLGLIAAVSLPGCTGGNASSNAVTPTEAATPTAITTTASDPSFPGEAAQLVNEETNTPVEITSSFFRL